MRIFLLLAAALPLAAQQHWVATWGTAQQQYRAASRGAPQTPSRPTPAAAPAPPPNGPARRFPVPPALPGLHNQTVRMIVRASIGGRSVRVRLSNALGAGTLTLGAAQLAIHSKDSAIVPGSDRALTFSGQP